MKINKILKDKNNIDLKYKILSNILNKNIVDLKTNKDIKINIIDYLKYKIKYNKAKKGYPIQYLFKKAYFYDTEYYVNKNVLIPRPETEILVNDTIKIINEKVKNPKIIEIGTGSGIIAITLKKYINNSIITATDISKKALKVAKRNAKNKKQDIEFIKTNLFEGIKERYDVLISNPPYIDYSDTNIDKNVKKYEPHLALFAPNEGTYFYEQILKNSKNILNKKNIILFEIGYNQKELLTKIVNKYYPNSKIIVKKDYNNYDRIMIISNNIE